MANFTVSLLLKLVDEATAPLRRVTGALGGLGGVAKAATSGFAMFGLAADGVRQATSLITAPLRLINDAIVEPTAKYEAFLTQLQTTEKTSEAAAKSFEWIKKFSAETPYRLDQVIAAFTRLRAFGLDPMDSLRKIGDASAAAGGASGETLMGVITAFGQSFAKTKLQAEEMNQLLERGVPAWDLLSTAMHKPIPELMDMASKGRLGRDAIVALIDEAGRASAGGMDRASQTFEGLTSTLEDLWEQLRVGIGQGGLLDLLKGGLRSINDTLTGMNQTGELQQLTKDLGGDLADAARAVAKLLPEAGQALHDVGDAIRWVGNEIDLAEAFWDSLTTAVRGFVWEIKNAYKGYLEFRNTIRGAIGLSTQPIEALPPKPGSVTGERGADDVAGGAGRDWLGGPDRASNDRLGAVVPSMFGAIGRAASAAPATGRVVVEFRNPPANLQVRRIDADGLDLSADLGWVMR